MANYSVRTLAGHFQGCDHGVTNQIKGKAFEDLACYLFETIPGVSIAMRNQMNAYHNEEIDVAIWNDNHKNGLNFLPNVILIECKNWSTPVSSIEVNWFCQKLASKGLDFGILIANNGITGNAADLTAAHNTIAFHLAQKRRIIVITRAEIDALTNTAQMIKLIKEKICLLAVSGRIS
ncbi:restriction endonuclease [Flavobacterium chungangensis]|uniref:Restriction endonuclease n=1 Tax=Flavobacterium chungangensis TaxID=2708132 RepID=A0ABV8ZHM3_9FLAO